MSKLCIIRCLVVIWLIEGCVSDFRQHPNWPKHLDQICGEINDNRISSGQYANVKF